MDEIIKARALDLAVKFQELSYLAIQKFPQLEEVYRQIYALGLDIELDLHVCLTPEKLDRPKVDKLGRVRFSRTDKKRMQKEFGIKVDF